MPGSVATSLCRVPKVLLAGLDGELEKHMSMRVLSESYQYQSVCCAERCALVWGFLECILSIVSRAYVKID